MACYAVFRVWSSIDGPGQPRSYVQCPAPVPGALAKASHATWAAAVAERCDTVCTIFHSCHRELVALDGTDDIRVRNWVQLLAEAMDVPASDAYLGWRKGGAPDIAAIEKAGPSRYQALVEPELRKTALPLASQR